MLDPRTGNLHIAEPNLLLQPEMCQAELEAQLYPQHTPAPWVLSPTIKLYGFTGVQIDGQVFNVIIHFYNDHLKDLLLRLDTGSAYATDAVTEWHRHKQHCKALRRWLKEPPPSRYRWGRVTVHYDMTRGGSEIRIRYVYL